MEFLPTSNEKMIKHVVELVPGSLYWAAVDIPLYSAYLKSEGIDSVGKPSFKHSVPSNVLSRPLPHGDFEVATENIDSNTSPQKHRRTAAKCASGHTKLGVPRVVYTDKIFVYRPLGRDFGPLDLSTTYRYIDFLDSQFSVPSVVIHVSDYRKPILCSNSAYLVSIYSLVRFGVTSEEIGAKLSSIPLIIPFRDASMKPKNTFPVTIQDCCEAFSTAVKLEWCDWGNFNLKRTEHFQHVDHGDLNWIFENKFMAFAGPSTDCLDEDGLDVLPPSHYVDIFKSFDIDSVVRLNVANYSPEEFTKNGIEHHDMFFEDGSCPPMKTVNAFLKLMDEKSDSTVAVHCKAGLGRSACMIGIWAMRHYQISARTFIAWARIARPGSVLGPQQHFLVELEKSLWKGGRVIHKSTHDTLGSQSPMGLKGDHGQGSRLLKQKRSTAIPL